MISNESDIARVWVAVELKFQDRCASDIESWWVLTTSFVVIRSSC